MSAAELKGIQRVISAAEIGAIRLVEVNAKTRVRSANEVGDKATVSVSHGARLKGAPAEDGTFTVVAMVDARVASSDPKVEPFVSIRAAFELSYRLPRAFQVSHQELQSFADKNAVFNAWPYFREIIQMTTTRMNLPPIVLPLFRLHAKATREVKKIVRTQPQQGRD